MPGWAPWRLFAAITMAWATIASAQTPPVAAPSRIVAVGDLHGDFQAWRAIAQAAGIENAAGHWSGGETVFVQTGDMVDRGPASLAIVQDMMRLQREAPAGHVVVLIGNHEAMNVTDDLRYVSAGDYAAFTTPDSAALRERVYAANRNDIAKTFHARDPRLNDAAIHAAWLAQTPLGMVEHQHAWHATGPIGSWVAKSPAVALIAGNLFVHGGISAAYAKQPIEAINRRVDAALAKGDTNDRSILTDALGPLWYRGLVTRDPQLLDLPADAPTPPPVEQEIDIVLKAYRADRIVVGHTPILTGIAVLDGGKLVRIDTGISAAYGGKLSYLEITGGTLVPHEVPRSH